MTLILDTGPIVAALNEQDPDHQRCAALLAGAQDLLIPSPVLVEVDYWLVKLAGPKVWSDFVADISRGAYRVAHPTDSDLTRAAELESTYADLDLGLVDACTIALCERLGETSVATLDQRHFSVVRPRHCTHLTLLPA
ncbi:MAG TPA: PIN domain-containing protein [Solirubrobacteraceae bacterium]|nr:PIN domain-containing protein [Solirubrobacteraceae bacterium]